MTRRKKQIKKDRVPLPVLGFQNSKSSNKFLGTQSHQQLLKDVNRIDEEGNFIHGN